ncbi:hypothetical protein ACIBKY_46355 [Nonomuraea sp. NPDC050394]|uniref:hypothetical protein n=1 Tax=Nonomuraea sp. NPDC050394 TaxID=3364363 RepID=UPI0037B79456
MPPTLASMVARPHEVEGSAPAPVALGGLPGRTRANLAGIHGSTIMLVVGDTEGPRPASTDDATPEFEDA